MHQESGRLGEVAEDGRQEHPPAGLPVRADTGTRGFIHSGRPIRSQIQPTITAVSSPAISLAHTMFGSLVNATAVAISTIGLIAGAESMNASDADGRTPRSISRFEIGTEPHSQPGSAAPQTVATGTASVGVARQDPGEHRGRARRPRSRRTPRRRGPGTGWPARRWRRRPSTSSAAPGGRGTIPAAHGKRWPATDRAEDLQRTGPVAACPRSGSVTAERAGNVDRSRPVRPVLSRNVSRRAARRPADRHEPDLLR